MNKKDMLYDWLKFRVKVQLISGIFDLLMIIVLLFLSYELLALGWFVLMILNSICFVINISKITKQLGMVSW